MLLPPAAACLLYKWLLSPIAWTVTVLLSRYLIGIHFDNLWGSFSFRLLTETLIVTASAIITAKLAKQLSGVRRLYLLLPLVLLPVPILLQMTGVHYRLVSDVVSSARLDAVLRIEYFVYLLTLLLLRPAIYASLCEFLLRSRALLPRKQSAMLVTAPFTYKMLTAPVSANDKNQRRCSRQDGSRGSPVRAIRATRHSYCSNLLVSTESLESKAICVLLVGRSTREHYKFVLYFPNITSEWLLIENSTDMTTSATMRLPTVSTIPSWWDNMHYDRLSSQTSGGRSGDCPH